MKHSVSYLGRVLKFSGGRTFGERLLVGKPRQKRLPPMPSLSARPPDKTFTRRKTSELGTLGIHLTSKAFKSFSLKSADLIPFSINEAEIYRALTQGTSETIPTPFSSRMKRLQKLVFLSFHRHPTCPAFPFRIFSRKEKLRQEQTLPQAGGESQGRVRVLEAFIYHLEELRVPIHGSHKDSSGRSWESPR